MKREVAALGAAVLMVAGLSNCTGGDGETTSKPIEQEADNQKVTDGNQNSTPVTKTNNDGQSNEPMNDAQAQFQENVKRAQERIENDPKLRSENNTSSIYRYLTSNDDFAEMGKLIEASSLKKTLHHEKFTMFVPSDDAWNGTILNAVKIWAKNRETDKVDSYLRQYILQPVVTSEKIQKTEQLTSIGNYVLNFADTAATVNGIGFVKHDYTVNNGIVIRMNGSFPISD